jgi:hypothetical protein
MKRFIVMTFGFAEDASVAPLIYQYQRGAGLASMKSAITSLALDLYAKYREDSQYQLYQKTKQCCKQTLNSTQHAKFCMECGSRLVFPSFSPDDFMSYIKELRSTTFDSYGEMDGTADRDFDWTPCWTRDFIGAPKEEVIYIAECAERVLVVALLEANPELLPEKQWVYWSSISTDWGKFRKEEEPTYE